MTTIGKELPSWNVIKLCSDESSRVEVSLQSIADEGKFLVVDFWTRCNTRIYICIYIFICLLILIVL